MSISRATVCCLSLAIAVCASATSVARAQALPYLRGEGTYSGDLSGPLIVVVNDNFGRTSLWVDGVIYGGTDRYPETPGVIGFDHQFLAGGVSITREPFEGGEFTAMSESDWGHVMMFEGVIENNVASGTWTLDYNEDSSECRNSGRTGRSCATRTGAFEVPLAPVGPANTVQPLDLTSVCGAIGPAMLTVSLLGVFTFRAGRRRRRAARR
ncbi:MAG TPA: hypothetical protein P5081_12325 [Phycisphaerae bacterium]|nr:hypothetical protein [Phycisphaerae bacterium]